MKILFYAFIASIVVFFGSHSGQLFGGLAALAAGILFVRAVMNQVEKNDRRRERERLFEEYLRGKLRDR